MLNLGMHLKMSLKKTLEYHGIFLPEGMTLEFQKPNSDRPRIVVYEKSLI